MAERRMFSKQITETDAFLDMPFSAQTLYFHLCMAADDDGFISSPKKIQRMVGCSGEDMNLLAAKHFVIPFKSGILAVKHWKIHNQIQKDRYHPTKYEEEKGVLQEKPNGAYTLSIDGYGYVSSMYTKCIQYEPETETEVSIGKVSKGKYREDISLADQVGEEEARPAQIEAEFEELWKLYPRKDGKKDALRYYQRARKKGTTFEQVRAGILNYCEYIRKEGKDLKYVAYGSTWFNGERWNDEYVSTKQPTTLDIAKTMDLSDWGVK